VSSVPRSGVGTSASTIAATAILLAASLAGVVVPARAVTDMVGVAGARAPTSWSTGGFAPDPPPPPDWCTPDNPDPACHPPPRRTHYGRFL
jgi:hypothetical protein